LVSGIFISLIGENYHVVSIFIAFFTILEILLWFFALNWYHEDKERVKKLLEQLANEISSGRTN